MRKRAFLFFFLLVSVLVVSCKGGGLAIISVEPRMVYEFSEEGEAEQFLFVFVKTEDCDEARSMSLSCRDLSLSWRCLSPGRISKGLFYAAFSPAPSSTFSKSNYIAGLTDFYGGTVEQAFSLAYDESMASLSEQEVLASKNFTTRYAYYGKSGRLEIFGEIDKDRDMLRKRKDLGGRRLCCVSQDGTTVCLFPYRKID
ncbi:MAG: hypothetical protein K6G18_12070 [Treponema sp.]|nr:hypothetical protein [Treponema sp.]